MRADTVKIAALGNNGVLTIGGGTLSADTSLQLYAPNGNGKVVFVGNVRLTGTSTKSIAGDSVTINNGVLVNVTGPAASVYVNSVTGGAPKANYTGFGGNGQTTGTFGGSGAKPAASQQRSAARRRARRLDRDRANFAAPGIAGLTLHASSC